MEGAGGCGQTGRGRGPSAGQGVPPWIGHGGSVVTRVPVMTRGRGSAAPAPALPSATVPWCHLAGGQPALLLLLQRGSPRSPAGALRSAPGWFITAGPSGARHPPAARPRRGGGSEGPPPCPGGGGGGQPTRDRRSCGVRHSRAKHFGPIFGISGAVRAPAAHPALEDSARGGGRGVEQRRSARSAPSRWWRGDVRRARRRRRSGPGGDVPQAGGQGPARRRGAESAAAPAAPRQTGAGLHTHRRGPRRAAPGPRPQAARSSGRWVSVAAGLPGNPAAGSSPGLLCPDWGFLLWVEWAQWSAGVRASPRGPGTLRCGRVGPVSPGAEGSTGLSPAGRRGLRCQA